MDAAAEREFAEFAAARAAALFRVAFLLTGHREAAEDLLQTALAKVALRWSRIRTEPERYARRVLYHEQVNRWRLRSWRRELPSSDLHEGTADGDAAAAADLRLSLAAALRRLPDRQRAVVVLRFYEDLSERDIADLLDISIGTVRTHAARALARLRTLCPDLVDLDPTHQEVQP